MKKMTAAFIVGLCALTVLSGCGNGKKNYVELGEYMGMEIEAQKAELTDDDIRNYVNQTLAMYPDYETIEKDTVEDGDTVDINYEGKMDGEAFAGGTAENHILKIGSHSFIEGFEDGLVGAKVNESRSLDLKFPDPYQNNPDFSGKPVVFDVKVNRIVKTKEMTYDTMTDEYVSEKFGQATVEQFLEDVKKTLDGSNDYYAQASARSSAIAKLQEICTVKEIPKDMLKERVEEYKSQAEKSYEAQGSSLEDYLKQANITEEEYQEQITEDVKSSLEFELILDAIAEKEKLDIDDEEYQTFVDSMLGTYGFATEEELYEQYDKDYVRQICLGNKVLDYVVQNAKVNYTVPTPDSASGTESDTETPEEDTKTEDGSESDTETPEEDTKTEDGSESDTETPKDGAKANKKGETEE